MCCFIAETFIALAYLALLFCSFLLFPLSSFVNCFGLKHLLNDLCNYYYITYVIYLSIYLSNIVFLLKYTSIFKLRICDYFIIHNDLCSSALSWTSTINHQELMISKRLIVLRVFQNWTQIVINALMWISLIYILFQLGRISIQIKKQQLLRKWARWLSHG